MWYTKRSTSAADAPTIRLQSTPRPNGDAIVTYIQAGQGYVLYVASDGRETKISPGLPSDVMYDSLSGWFVEGHNAIRVAAVVYPKGQSGKTARVVYFTLPLHW
jgi:hypothetical protein